MGCKQNLTLCIYICQYHSLLMLINGRKVTPFPPVYQVHRTWQYTATFLLKEQTLYFCRSILKELKSFEDTLYNPYLHTRKTAHVLLFQSIYNIHAKKATDLSGKGIRSIFQRLFTLLDTAILLACTSDKLPASLSPVQTVYFSSSNIKETKTTWAGFEVS